MSVAAEPAGAVEEEWFDDPLSQPALAWRRFLRNRLAVVGLFVLVVLFTVGFLARQIAPYGYLELDLTSLAKGPSAAHFFGTDQLGRDYFSRVILGIGTEATIALLVGLVGTLIGTLLGAVAGYFGGVVDNLVMRLTDLLLTLPPLLVLLVAASNLNATTVLSGGRCSWAACCGCRWRGSCGRGPSPFASRRRQIEHGSGLGRHRWVVERTFAWLHNRRRLLIRTDRRDDIHESFLALACCLICWQQLENSSS